MNTKPENRWSDDAAPKSDGLEPDLPLQPAGRGPHTGQHLRRQHQHQSVENDHLGRDVTVLWVKGSGSDIASITEKGFAGLKLDEVLPLFDRPSMTDEEMTAYLDRTAFEGAARARASKRCCTPSCLPSMWITLTRMRSSRIAWPATGKNHARKFR